MNLVPALVLARWLHLAGLMLVLGSAALLALLRTHVPELAIESGFSRHIRILALATALLGAVAWFALATGQMAGDVTAAWNPNLLWLAARGTLFGQVFAVRLVLLLALCASLALDRESLTALLAAAALALVSVTSHAAQATPMGFGAVGIICDAAHLVTAGFWIGGLFVLSTIMVQRAEAPRLAGALGIFGQWGMVAVAVLVMTGMVNAATIVLGGAGHASLLYLGVLGAKLVLVVAMIALALRNHFRLLPQQPANAMALKDNISWELGLGMGAVLLASLLGMLQPTL